MKLDALCREKKVDAAGLAKKFGVSRRTAYRWLRGERIPDKPTMRRITRWSSGRVTANDFYDVPAMPLASR